jgi:Ca2+-binding RTX toxin-like protein
VNVSLWDGSSSPVGDATNQAEWLVASSGTPITMNGSAGADHLTGGSGADRIIGGAGADILTGGPTSADTFVYNNSGTIGAGASNSDSNVAAMDHITDFQHGLGHQDIIEVNGFGFSAASTATVTANNIAAGAYTSASVVGYFADGNVVHTEKQTLGTVISEQIYIDANKDGNFDPTKDIVIHLDNFSRGLTSADFQFH